MKSVGKSIKSKKEARSIASHSSKKSALIKKNDKETDLSEFSCD